MVGYFCFILSLFGGRVEQLAERASTVGLVPNGIHMLTTIDPSLSAKPSMEDFWNLESISITDSPSQSDECELENFSKTVIFC